MSPSSASQLRKRVLVVGNYWLDQLQSMERYAQLLLTLYGHEHHVTLRRPFATLALVPGLPHSVRKYLAYFDKLLLFPLWLWFRSRSFDLVHIADHGNAFYSFFSPAASCIVTCHDLLAVRSGLGDSSIAMSPSPIGSWLQRMIMAGLRHSRRVVFDSQATRSDFIRLGLNSSRQRLAVIPIPLNAAFSPTVTRDTLSLEEQRSVPQQPFLLMVGSAHPRKNRALALRLLEVLGAASPYLLVFAGDPLTVSEQSFQASHPLGGRLLAIPRPSHGLLNVLYCRAHALLFPSIAEGFGWPLIEAQACGCPVIASTTTSVPEVAGAAALFASPSDVDAYVRHVRCLEHPQIRNRLIQAGFANVSRFEPSRIRNQLLAIAFPPATPSCPSAM